MKLFSQEDINNLLSVTLAEKGITLGEMVGVVGNDIANEIISAYSPTTPVVMFAGPDECGAYALAAGIKLIENGYKVHTFLFNVGGNRLTSECAEYRSRYLASGAADEKMLSEVTGMRFSMPDLDSGMLIVDALFGANISGPLSRGYQVLVTSINESGAPIIAVDSPSGLPGNPMSGLINSKIIHADMTLTVMMPKLSFFIDENIELVGKWKVIGPTPSPAAIRRTRNSHFFIEAANIARRLKPRPYFSSKQDFGSAIIFAGSYGMMGAAVLASRAASRSGCGKVTCHSPRCGYNVVQTSVPSALFEGDRGERSIESIELTHNYSAVAIGPGIGTADCTLRALEGFLKIASANSRPVILDADALNCLAIKPSLLDHVPMYSILTPHAGEFDRIFGPQPSSSARLAKALDIARLYNVIIILKGYYTATVRPDGRVCYNSSGTPALATAGTGDVLTGLLAGLVAQGMKPESAAIVGVYLHGLAGRIAEKQHGAYGVTAEDVADNIGRAIRTAMER